MVYLTTLFEVLGIPTNLFEALGIPSYLPTFCVELGIPTYLFRSVSYTYLLPAFGSSMKCDRHNLSRVLLMPMASQTETVRAKHCCHLRLSHRLGECNFHTCNIDVAWLVLIPLCIPLCHPSYTDKILSQPWVAFQFVKTWSRKYDKFSTSFTDQEVI